MAQLCRQEVDDLGHSGGEVKKRNGGRRGAGICPFCRAVKTRPWDVARTPSTTPVSNWQHYLGTNTIPIFVIERHAGSRNVTLNTSPAVTSLDTNSSGTIAAPTTDSGPRQSPASPGIHIHNHCAVSDEQRQGLSRPRRRHAARRPVAGRPSSAVLRQPDT